MNISPTQRKLFDQDGFVVVQNLINPNSIPNLHAAFDDLFCGKFETGLAPDEVNWQEGRDDPALTRQICNGWKANRTIANVALDQDLAKAIAQLSGWPGVRLMIDNVIWKPVGARSLAYHQDNSYLSWFTPSELLSCWIALDDTSVSGGSLELVRGSHQWDLSEPNGEFHAPPNYRQSMYSAAAGKGEEPEIMHVTVPAGGGSFHHGKTWHGSGENHGNLPRRSLVLHAMPSDVEYVPKNFSQGIGPIYSRYKRMADNQLDENYFPIVWREDGYRTPQIDQFLGS